MNNFYVYAHIDDNGKVFYIGKGKGRRAWRYDSRGPYWEKYTKKHGLTVKILFNGLSEDHAFAVEKQQIAKYGRRDLGRGTLINLTDGGDGASGVTITKKHRDAISRANTGRVKSEETRARISKSNRGHSRNQGRAVSELQRKISREVNLGNKHSLGRIPSDFNKKRTAETNRGNRYCVGRKQTEKTKQVLLQIHQTPVYCIETKKRYISTIDADRSTGINQSSISKVCRGKAKTAGGFTWRFVEKEEI
jgi:hypothetical protein